MRSRPRAPAQGVYIGRRQSSCNCRLHSGPKNRGQAHCASIFIDRYLHSPSAGATVAWHLVTDPDHLGSSSLGPQVHASQVLRGPLITLMCVIQQASRATSKMQSLLEAVADLRAKAARTRDRQKAARLLTEADEQQLQYECRKTSHAASVEVCSPLASCFVHIRIAYAACCAL